MRGRRSGWIKRLYEEKIVSAQCASGNGALIPEACYVPGWFIRSELGMGAGEGPSIIYTQSTLAEQNERARNVQCHGTTGPGECQYCLARVMQTKQRKRSRTSSASYTRRAQQMLATA